MQKYKQIARSFPIFGNDCKRCSYYLKETIDEESMCMKFYKIKTDLCNPNSPNFERAKECRLDPYKCGEEGLYYFPKS